ncbi:MAG: TGS domain-containing protein [Actinobacteria bacterium]|nr:MAG: TGS domain-containing protein [Actinomycetota bacterium]
MAAEITITLPDGSTKNFPAGVTPAEIAASIGKRLARDALAARIWTDGADGEWIDLDRPIERDAKVVIVVPGRPRTSWRRRSLTCFPVRSMRSGPRSPTASTTTSSFREAPISPRTTSNASTLGCGRSSTPTSPSFVGRLRATKGYESSPTSRSSARSSRPSTHPRLAPAP